MGHFSFGVHRMLGVKPRYVSIFRRPIDRIVSLYRHNLRAPDPRYAGPLAAGMTLREFVGSSISEDTNNHMCRIVAGIPPESGLVIHARWLFELAIHNLDRHYEIVGVQEQAHGIAAKIAIAMGCEPRALPMHNVSEDVPPRLDDETLSVIRDFNALDILLYEHVLKRVERQ
jgi:hypothetical protein